MTDDVSRRCPHGISLDMFCQQLHDQRCSYGPNATECLHGIELDKFCRHLHRGDLS